jgi:ankyrin repeat protein
MSRPLPPLPDTPLDQIVQQAEDLRVAYDAGDAEARNRVHSHWDLKSLEKKNKPLTLEHAQSVIAREFGLHSWEMLRQYTQMPSQVQTARYVISSGDLAALNALLRQHPDLVAQSARVSFSLLIHATYILSGSTEAERHPGRVQIIQALLDAGAEVDENNSTPLKFSASFGDVSIAQCLLDAGANVNGLEEDASPLAFALYCLHGEMAELLFQRGSKMDLRLAAGLGRMDLMAGFFNEDGSLKSDAGALHTGLHYLPEDNALPPEEIKGQALIFACINGRVEAADFLLKKGVDVNATPGGFNRGLTPLRQTIGLGRGDAKKKVAEFLLSRGADVAAANFKSRFYEENPEFAGLFRKYGAKV